MKVFRIGISIIKPHDSRFELPIEIFLEEGGIILLDELLLQQV